MNKACSADKKAGGKREFQSAVMLGGFLSAVSLGIGVIRGKAIAIYLGVSGVGFLAQANQLLLLSASVGTLSMATGIVHQLASKPYKDDPERSARMLQTAFSVQFGLSLLIVLGGVIWSADISNAVFGTPSEGGSIIAVLAGVPLYVLSSGYLAGVFFGFNRYDLYVRASIWAVVSGFAVFVPLLWTHGLGGAIWAITALGTIYFLSFLFFTRELVPFRVWFRPRLDWRELRPLLRFSFVLFFTGASLYASNLIVRRMVIDELGLTANGLLQVALALTAYYTPFLTNPLWGRLHPQVIEKGDSPAAREELCSALRINVLLNSCIIVSLLIAPEYLIRLAYSWRFQEALELIPIQLLGDFFYFLVFAFSVYVLGAGRLRWYFGGWILYYASVIGFTNLLLPSLGLQAVPAAYLAVNAAAAIVGAAWFMRTTSASIALPEAWRYLGCLTAVLGQIFIFYNSEQPLLRLVIPGILACVFRVVWRDAGKSAAS